MRYRAPVESVDPAFRDRTQGLLEIRLAQYLAFAQRLTVAKKDGLRQRKFREPVAFVCKQLRIGLIDSEVLARTRSPGR